MGPPIAHHLLGSATDFYMTDNDAIEDNVMGTL